MKYIKSPENNPEQFTTKQLRTKRVYTVASLDDGDDYLILDNFLGGRIAINLTGEYGFPLCEDGETLWKERGTVEIRLVPLP